MIFIPFLSFISNTAMKTFIIKFFLLLLFHLSYFIQIYSRNELTCLKDAFNSLMKFHILLPKGLLQPFTMCQSGYRVLWSEAPSEWGGQNYIPRFNTQEGITNIIFLEFTEQFLCGRQSSKFFECLPNLNQVLFSLYR